MAMFFKRLLTLLISITLAYAPISMAQSQSMVPVGWTKSISSTGFVTFSAPPNTGSGTSRAANLIWESALASRGTGGATFTANNSLPVGAVQVATVTKGAVSAATVFTAVKTIVGATAGPVMLTLTALSAAQMMFEYFNTSKTRLGPASSRETSTPFEIQKQVPGVSYLINVSSGNDFTGSSPEVPCSAVGNFYSANGFPGATGVTLGGVTCSIRNSSGAEITSRPISKLNTTLEWFPASMNDIAPYMDAPSKIVTPAQIEEILKTVPMQIIYPAENGTYFPAGTLSVSVNPSLIDGTPTSSVTETATKKTTTTTTPQTDIKTGTQIDPVTGKPVPTVVTSPSQKVVVTETDKGTGATTIVSTTKNETPPVAAQEVPDLCKLHPEVVACVTPDKIDQCKLHPESLGCKEFDSPTVPELETKDIQISISPSGGFGPSGGSCPAPRQLKSGGAVFSFQPFCDYMTALRPVLIAVSWLSASMIVIGASRKE